jgi:hypothetical protein
MQDHDIILGAYFRADGSLTPEQLYATYPVIARSRLAMTALDLERLGYIKAVPDGGHIITDAGCRRWTKED